MYSCVLYWPRECGLLLIYLIDRSVYGMFAERKTHSPLRSNEECNFLSMNRITMFWEDSQTSCDWCCCLQFLRPLNAPGSQGTHISWRLFSLGVEGQFATSWFKISGGHLTCSPCWVRTIIDWHCPPPALDHLSMQRTYIASTSIYLHG